VEVQRAVIGRKRHKTRVVVVGITSLSLYRDVTTNHLADTGPLKAIRISATRDKKHTKDNRGQ
jgi:hypothetical protein